VPHVEHDRRAAAPEELEQELRLDRARAVHLRELRRHGCVVWMVVWVYVEPAAERARATPGRGTASAGRSAEARAGREPGARQGRRRFTLRARAARRGRGSRFRGPQRPLREAARAAVGVASLLLLTDA
jgi:hypothetical protein